MEEEKISVTEPLYSEDSDSKGKCENIYKRVTHAEPVKDPRKDSLDEPGP